MNRSGRYFLGNVSETGCEIRFHVGFHFSIFKNTKQFLETTPNMSSLQFSESNNQKLCEMKVSLPKDI